MLADAGVAAFTEPVGVGGRGIAGPSASVWPAFRNLAALVILVGTGVLLYSQQGIDYLGPLTANSKDSGGMVSKPFEQAKLQPAAPQEGISDGLNHPQAPAPQKPGSPTPNLNQDVALLRETVKRDEAQTLQAHEPPAEKATPSKRGQPRGKITTATTKSVIAIKVPDNRTRTSEKLSSQISKAISDRAIEGVEVSVMNKTVNLAGRVATERQRTAAVLAARSVPGVTDIRDQIIVDWGVVPATIP